MTYLSSPKLNSKGEKAVMQVEDGQMSCWIEELCLTEIRCRKGVGALEKMRSTTKRADVIEVTGC